MYIHERGDSIIQNAIVGVFLRVLEYYRGVLFMTTNRTTVIDDAIVSRLTARFTYKQPGKEEKRELWRILGNQNSMGFSDKTLDELVGMFPNVTGRDIKNLLKLGIMVAKRRGESVTVETMKEVERFKQ